jgi:molybdopterin-guanine dinucleotide biosynthesis protein A
MRAAGLVLAGGRSSRMGVPKAALEWHGSTLLRRTCGVLQRAGLQPVVVVRAPGQELRLCRPTSRWSTTRAKGSVRCRAWPSG